MTVFMRDVVSPCDHDYITWIDQRRQQKWFTRTNFEPLLINTFKLVEVIWILCWVRYRYDTGRSVMNLRMVLFDVWPWKVEVEVLQFLLSLPFPSDNHSITLEWVSRYGIVILERSSDCSAAVHFTILQMLLVFAAVCCRDCIAS